jgi:hypothetical protein
LRQQNNNSFSAKEIWKEYLILVEKFLPRRVSRILRNKRVLFTGAVITIIQVAIYIAIYLGFSD